MTLSCGVTSEHVQGFDLYDRLVGVPSVSSGQVYIRYEIEHLFIGLNACGAL
jgi:hypothetical protein